MSSDLVSAEEGIFICQYYIFSVESANILLISVSKTKFIVYLFEYFRIRCNRRQFIFYVESTSSLNKCFPIHLIVILLCMKVQIYSITMKHGIEDVLLIKSYNQYLQNWVGIVQKNSVNDLTQDLNFFKRKWSSSIIWPLWLVTCIYSQLFR